MSNTTETSKPNSTHDTFVKMVTDLWHSTNKRMDDTLANLTDEQLLQETSPGRNTGRYLLGHLTAVNDAMLPLLGFGEKMYPQLEKPFIATPDKSGQEMPPISELRKYWHTISEKLDQHIAEQKPSDWFAKHNSVSAEDFAKEPHRNKLNIVLGRANHLNYHLGQLNFLKEKKK